MQRLAIFIGAIAIALAAGASFLGASLIADFVERSTTERVSDALGAEGFDWASVLADGLLVKVSGPAPSEVARFKALAAAKTVVNASRVRDGIKIVDPNDLAPPRFSLELLRNDDGISLIGLIPDQSDRDKVVQKIKDASASARITDMLETADFPPPPSWQPALDFALDNLPGLPRSKISVTATTVTITAITGSQQEKAGVEKTLSDARPDGVELVLHITAPRPVITPFSLRLIKDRTGTRFDSCSADTEKARAKILEAAFAAGVPDGSDCAIGLGAPSPRWAAAAVLGIKALDALGGGELTFSDADITLIATEDTLQSDFDRIVFNLEQSLPDVFSVHAILPPKPVMEGAAPKSDIPEYVVTKSPEGLVQMRGRLRTERTKQSVHNFATALFGKANVHDTTRLNADLPDGWPTRILAGLQGLQRLHNGLLTINPDMVELRGISDRPEVKTEVTQILSQELGDKYRYLINITYEPALNRQTVKPTPEECVARINAILKKKQIAFKPSAASINADSMPTMEKIAEAMADCTDVPMEIGGYTDSQGRESMNLTLSQSRAETVLDTLLSLDVLTNRLTAKGYGEANPIADNKTEEGRKANRRIEFRLIGNDNSTANKTPPRPTAAAPEAPHTDPAKKTEKSNGKN